MRAASEQREEVSVHVHIEVATSNDVIIEPAAALFVPKHLVDCIFHTLELASTMLRTRHIAYYFIQSSHQAQIAADDRIQINWQNRTCSEKGQIRSFSSTQFPFRITWRSIH